MASGVEIACLSLEEYDDLMPDSGRGTSVRCLKSRLEEVIGQPRFRQRLLCGERIVSDDEVLELPLVLHLVLLSVVAPSLDMLERMTMALDIDDASVVEDFLCQPHDPNLEVQGLTCLSFAASSGSLRSAKLLLEAKAVLEKGSSLSANTPLQWACCQGCGDFTTWLLQSQADVRKLMNMAEAFCFWHPILGTWKLHAFVSMRVLM